MIRSLRPFLIVATLLVLASLVLEHLNGRFWLNDFRVYYMAAENMRHGLPIYGEVFGEDTGLYKYAPVVLYFFQPYTFLPYQTAGVLHFLLVGIMLMGCFVVIERSLVHVTRDLPKPALRAIIGFLCIAVLFVRELHMGNINMGLILLAAFGVERFMAGKRISAGLAWGIVWLIKPYLLLMIVPLVIRGEWRVLRTAASTMLVGLVFPLLIEGPQMWWELLREWVDSMLYHTQVMESPDRFSSMLGKPFGLDPSPWLDLVLIMLAGCFLTVMAWEDRKRERSAPETILNTGFELWFTMALVPNLVITDQQHFMFSLPLILFTLAWLSRRQDLPVLFLFILAMVLYATRSSDLWGNSLENTLVGHGVLGSGNFLLMATSWLAWRHWRSMIDQPQAPQAPDTVSQ